MRTTLTLDDDVVRMIEDAVHTQRRPMKQVINDALRSALRPSAEAREPYRLVAHHATLQPGLDIAGFNRLADELEDDEIVRKSLGNS